MGSMEANLNSFRQWKTMKEKICQHNVQTNFQQNQTNKKPSKHTFKQSLENTMDATLVFLVDTVPIYLQIQNVLRVKIH